MAGVDGDWTADGGDNYIIGGGGDIRLGGGSGYRCLDPLWVDPTSNLPPD
ncbi:conserved hypothetical protein [Ricinus communis]|uniref:Uncharacterized protein n=1 Tax=Ricinus communis TaxID=3988 RepID=B9SQM1_RICCO|nr:conserved hypothetical protein [Ricinus communis]